MMAYWLRASAYAMIPGGGSEARRLRPGEAVAYNPAVHDAVIAELAAGRPCPVELLEADADPTLPAPPDDGTQFAYSDTRSSAGGAPVHDVTGRVLGHEHRGDPQPPDAGRVEPEPASPSEAAAYAQHVRELEAAYAQQRGAPDLNPTTTAEEATR